MKKIFIVDDSKFACRCLKEAILEYDNGLDFELVTDSQKAIETYSENSDSISCMIVDFNMPNINGLELSEKLKEINPNLPILMLTATSAFETGAREAPEWLKVVSKPINAEKVAEIMEYFKGQINE